MSIALLVQGALGGAFLVILVLILVAAVVLLAAVFGGTLGGDSSNGETTAPLVPPGTIMAASGLGLACLEAYYGSIGFGFLGIILGGMAYYRGSRVLGIVASVLSFAAIFIGYYLGYQTAQFGF
jgi:hypothetical protein